MRSHFITIEFRFAGALCFNPLKTGSEKRVSVGDSPSALMEPLHRDQGIASLPTLAIASNYRTVVVKSLDIIKAFHTPKDSKMG